MGEEPMTRVQLLYALRDFTEQTTGGIILPVARQKEDKTEPEPRAATVYLMRLPDSGAARKKAPYIIHQLLTGKDVQEPGKQEEDTANVRSIFCVYHNDEQEGGLALLSLMEQLRIALLQHPVLSGGKDEAHTLQGGAGHVFTLDLRAGVEALAYPDDTAPYYAGEMMTTWRLPPVERVDTWGAVRPQFDPGRSSAPRGG
jgi:hypothetical protein